MLKRYLVFAFAAYEESGGWNDFEDSFDTLEEATACAKGPFPYYDNSHIVDSHTGEIVERFKPEIS